MHNISSVRLLCIIKQDSIRWVKFVAINRSSNAASLITFRKAIEMRYKPPIASYHQHTIVVWMHI